MFKYKEKRVNIIESEFKLKLQNNGFKNINVSEYYMYNFNINNWIENSSIDKEKKIKILQMHINAPLEIKEVYNMKINKKQITIDSKYMIITGQKIYE